MNYFPALQTLTADINWLLILPELIIGVFAVVVMLFDAFLKPSQRWVTGSIAIASLIAAGVATIYLWPRAALAGQTAFNGMIVLDHLRLSFTLIMLFVSLLTVLISVIWVE